MTLNLIVTFTFDLDPKSLVWQLLSKKYLYTQSMRTFKQ